MGHGRGQGILPDSPDLLKDNSEYIQTELMTMGEVSLRRIHADECQLPRRRSRPCMTRHRRRSRPCMIRHRGLATRHRGLAIVASRHRGLAVVVAVVVAVVAVPVAGIFIRLVAALVAVQVVVPLAVHRNGHHQPIDVVIRPRKAVRSARRRQICDSSHKSLASLQMRYSWDPSKALAWPVFKNPSAAAVCKTRLCQTAAIQRMQSSFLGTGTACGRSRCWSSMSCDSSSM